MSQPQRRGVCLSLAFTLSLCLVLLPAPARAQAQIFQYLALRDCRLADWGGAMG